MASERLGRGAVLGAMMAAAVALQLAGYWPGVMIWDAIHQYEQALSGHYTDWHPPIMQWLWRRLLPIAPGPGPMLAVQLGLFWSGWALLLAQALRRGWNGAAVALTLAAWVPIPLALLGAVIKDCLMAGALLAASGLILTAGARGRAARGGAILLLLLAAAVRFNGAVAAVPLAVAAVPAAWRQGRARTAAWALAAAVPLALTPPLIARALHAEKTDVALSLVIFDLAGITERSGADAFPPLPVADAVAVNHRCYTPELWDRYAWWVADPCPIQFAGIRAAFAAHGESAYGWWARAVLAHPLAYASHRLAHFNIDAGFLVARLPTRPVFDETNANPWGFRTAANAAMRGIDRAARWSALTPLGWPIAWMALAAGLLALGGRLERARAIVPVAASALLYGLSYLPLGVAAETRYHLWTMVGASVALALSVGDPGWRHVSRRRLVATFAPTALVILLGAIARLQ